MMIPLTLQLDWLPNAQFAGVLFAHSLGWYQQADIDLSIVPWQANTNPVDALAAGGNVIASTEDNLLIRARSAGQPVKAIGVMMQYSGIGWTTLQSSGIRTIADLAGKRVGVHGDGVTALQIALRRAGLTPDAVEVIEIGFDYRELLASKRLDAVQCLVMVEPLELEDQGLALHTLAAYQWGYEVYAQVLATPERLIAAQPEMLTRFLRVTFDGWRLALAQPHEVARLISEHYLPGSKAELQARMVLALRPMIEGTVGADRLGWMEPARWEQSIELLRPGHLQRPMRAEEVMTNALMEQSLNA